MKYAVHWVLFGCGHPRDRRRMLGAARVKRHRRNRHRVRAATRATYATFIGSGFAMASWATDPADSRRVGLTPSRLGL